MSDLSPISDEELPELFAGLKRTPLALAVSGGADSMALMHMVARWAARDDVREGWAKCWAASVGDKGEPGKSADGGSGGRDGAQLPPWLRSLATVDDLRRAGGPPHVVVLTVDHGLRPQAAEEAVFVAREAAALGLPCAILRWDGEKPTTGIQAAARQARRNLLVDAVDDEAEFLAAVLQPHGLRLSRGARTLVMAHHQEDQAETVLMRLARGSGLDGLAGMRTHGLIAREATLDRPLARTALLARPLLGVSKARLEATLRAYGAAWIEDPSNDDERFERVRMRKVLRQLEPLGFTAEKIALSARRLADAEMSFVRLLDGADGDARTETARGLFEDVDLSRVDFASRYTAGRLLRRVLAMYGGAARPAELSQIEQLAARTTRPVSRSRIGALTLGGCNVQPHGEGVRYLRIFREGNGEGLPTLPIAPEHSVSWDGTRFTLCAAAGTPSGAIVRALGMQGWADLKRTVKGLGDLGWPAAAAATLPVISADGAIIAYPAIDGLVRRLPDGAERVRERWAEFSRGLSHPADYKALFAPRAW